MAPIPVPIPKDARLRCNSLNCCSRWPVDRGSRYGTYLPGFSEVVALGGSRVDTGHAVLVGMPRIEVTFPNVFHELAGARR